MAYMDMFIDLLLHLGSWGFGIYMMTLGHWISVLIGIAGIILIPSVVDYVLLHVMKVIYGDSIYGNFAKADMQSNGDEATKLPIVYSEDYNITACGIEKMHPFDSEKYRHVHEGLLTVVGGRHDTHKPHMASRVDLLRVHTPGYLARLHLSWIISSILEVPVCVLPALMLRFRVLYPMLHATGGSIMAAELAFRKGWAINLSGGYHHASASRGGGFCAFADITLSIRHLQAAFPKKARRFIVLDLDAHQGNGHERDFLGDDDVFIVDFYNPHIYPDDRRAKKAINKTVHVSRQNDTKYIALLDATLTEVLDERFPKPDLLVYNAGTDCMMNDPLGHMNLTSEGIIARDACVFRHCFQRNIPVLMVLSGGYQKINAPTISSSILNLLQEFNLLEKISEESKTL